LVAAVLAAVAVATVLTGGAIIRSRRVVPLATSSGLLDHFAIDAEHDRLERLALQERYAEAFRAAVGVLGERARRVGPMAPATLASLQWTASIASLGGDQRTAADLLDALVAMRRVSLTPDDPVIADTLLRRGRVARLVEETPTAIRLYAEARHIVESRGGPLALAVSLEEAEAGLQLRTDLEGAARAYQLALDLGRRAPGGAGFQLASLEAWLGWSLDRLGRPEEAAPHLADARRVLGDLGLEDVMLEATMEQLQADQLAFKGRFAEAETEYLHAAATNERARARFLGGFARRMCPPDGYEELALAALQRQEGDRAWVLLERGRAAMHRDLIALRAWERRDPIRLAEADSLRRNLLEVKHLLEAARRRGEGAWTEATWTLTLRALDLRARQSVLEDQALVAMGPWTPSLAATQAALDPHSAILGYLQVNIGGAPSIASEPRRSWGYLYVLRDRGPVHWVPLWDDRTIPDDLTARSGWGPVFARVRRAAEWPLHVDADPQVIDQLREYARHYFDPALPYLDGVDRLVVEGTRVPLEPARGSDGHFVGERFDVTYAPSAALLPLLSARRGRRGERGPRSVLAITPSGDRLGDAALVTLALGDDRRDLRLLRTSFEREEARLDRLPHLRFAGLEADAVARRFPDATVLRGAADAEGSLRRLAESRRLAAYDVIHVATHTLSDGAPERCGLVLSEHEPSPASDDDGVLDAEEVLLGWDLSGSLLTLSACESARAAGTWRGEELGLTPALFAAGAGHVLVSLWTVDDRATALLMDRFYADLTGRTSGHHPLPAGGHDSGTPMPPGAALREAKSFLRTLTDASGRRPFEHPAYWSGFILMGPPDPA
jgi:CHAT domain-containing protein